MVTTGAGVPWHRRAVPLHPGRGASASRAGRRPHGDLAPRTQGGGASLLHRRALHWLSLIPLHPPAPPHPLN